MRGLLIALIALAGAVHADEVLTVNLDSTTLTGLPGQVLAFTGTLTNNTDSTVYLNNDSASFALPLDGAPFLNNAPFTLDPLATSFDFEMFDVTIPHGQAPGTYNGTFFVQGGADSNALAEVGAATFSVNVGTPEPASYLLCGAAIVLLLRRRSLLPGRRS